MSETRTCLCCLEMKAFEVFPLRRRSGKLVTLIQPCKACRRNVRRDGPARVYSGMIRDVVTGLLPIQAECIARRGLCAGCPAGGWLESAKCRIKGTPEVKARLKTLCPATDQGRE